MNKKINLIVILAIVLLLSAAGMFYYFNRAESPIDKVSSGGFNFIYNNGGDAVDTFSGKLTKDLISDPDITVDFRFSDEEMAAIGQKIDELKLLERNPKKISNSDGAMTPCFSRYLKVQSGSIAVEKVWDDCGGVISDEYLQFEKFMWELITSQPEYKELPPARGGYL